MVIVDSKIVELSVFAVVSSDVNNVDSVKSALLGLAVVFRVVVSAVLVYPVDRVVSCTTDVLGRTLVVPGDELYLCVVLVS